MFLVGSDPEVFLRDRSGKLISSIGKVGGSKDFPMKTKHGYVQEDNVLVEFNSVPAGTEDDFVKHITASMSDIEEIVKPLDLLVSIDSSGLFEDDELLHYLARLAGCEADFDAWDVRINNAPDLDATNLRTAGGHLHISFDEAGDDENIRMDLVRALDLVAGVPSVIMDRDTERRTLYGKPGACRPKFTRNDDDYDGVEYRVLSNFWLQSERHMRWAFRAVERTITNLDDFARKAAENKEAIFHTLNTGDMDVARDLSHRFDLEVVNG